MATKGQIVEQVLKLVNGGDISDDSKATMQEVGTLLEHERDALVRKTVMENAAIGEHEIPSEFLSYHKLLLSGDETFGSSPRPYAKLPQMPVNLPNDGSIYRVCRMTSPAYKDHVDAFNVTAPAYTQDNGAYSDNGFDFTLKTGTHDIGNKFVLSFEHGPDASTLKSYQFTFNYEEPSDSYNNARPVTERSIKPAFLHFSLMKNKAFTKFLEGNRLYFHYFQHNEGVNDSFRENFRFISSDLANSFGAANADNLDVKSVLTNESIISTDTTNPTVNASWTAGDQDTYPTSGLIVQIWYPKNKRLFDMEADSLGVKAKGSCYLNCALTIDAEEMETDGYSGVTSAGVRRMFINRFGAILKQYGVEVDFDGPEGGSAQLIFKESYPLGGFSNVVVPTIGTVGGTLAAYSAVAGSKELSELAKGNDMTCYSRMPNPGIYSKMYDSAINLSGRKYWYRQEGRIYLYNEALNFDLGFGEISNAESYILVWMLSKSSSLGFNDEFPMPSDAIKDVIASLVSTFTTMRAAKEDLTNDNVDIV